MATRRCMPVETIDGRPARTRSAPGWLSVVRATCASRVPPIRLRVRPRPSRRTRARSTRVNREIYSNGTKIVTTDVPGLAETLRHTPVRFAGPLRPP